MTTRKSFLDRVLGRYSVLVTPAAATGLIAAEAVLKATERGVKQLLIAIDPDAEIPYTPPPTETPAEAQPDLVLAQGSSPVADVDGGSLLCLQDGNGANLVTVNMTTGKVIVADPDRVDAAADLFWKAIYAAWRNGFKHIPFRNFIVAGGRGAAGDILMKAGSGQFVRIADREPNRGGDLIIEQVDEQEFERP